jgi:hypothetical protein
MKKILQIIFSKTSSRSLEQPLKDPVIFRRLADSPESLPGERIDLQKRQLTSAPVEFEAAPGRI